MQWRKSGALLVTLLGAALGGCDGCDAEVTGPSGGAGGAGATGVGGAGASNSGGQGGAEDFCLSLGTNYSILDERYCNDGYFQGSYQVFPASTDYTGGIVAMRYGTPGQVYAVRLVVASPQLQETTFTLDVSSFGYPDAANGDFLYRIGTTDYFFGRLGAQPDGLLYIAEANGGATSALPADENLYTLPPDGSAVFSARSLPEPGVYRQSLAGSPPSLGAVELVVATSSTPVSVAVDSEGTLFAIVGHDLLAWSKEELASNSPPHVTAAGTPAGSVFVRSPSAARPAMVFHDRGGVIDAAEYHVDSGILTVGALTGLLALDQVRGPTLDAAGAIWLLSYEGASVLRPN
ncbi:MAG: hypothetical protein U0271_15315 [Polyangiaceae bacterium]